MTLEKFDRSVDSWLNELVKYDLKSLHQQPSPAEWSLGQVFMHLIVETNWFLAQGEHCFVKIENIDEPMSEAAKIMFKNDSFPNEIIKKDPFIIHDIPHPVSIEEVRLGLIQLEIRASNLWDNIASGKKSGKSKHPGHLYFSPIEWLQYSEMHLRHHFRQKSRIDQFLIKYQKHKK